MSIRARVRKSKRSIDPEFDPCVETLVSFVDTHDNETDSKQKRKGGAHQALILTPVPTAVPTVRVRSLSRGGSLAPVKRRNRSFGPNNPVGSVGGNNYSRKGSAGSLTSSNLSHSGNHGIGAGSQSDGENLSDGEGMMMDVSLEDEKVEVGEDGVTTTGPGLPPGGSCAANNDRLLSISLHSHPAGLPKHPSAHHINGGGRYASPLAVLRTSSGVSNISSAQSDHLSSSVRSQSSRSRSRSRSRRRMGGGGHMRMRSLGAASAFASASNSNSGQIEMEELDGASNAAVTVEPISIPLKDILSVDEEIPSRNGGIQAGGSDFYSSAVSDVEAAKEVNGPQTPTAASNAAMPKSPTPPQSNNGKVLYRIFLHTLSHGYVEFSLDHVNSHDIFMAYLKAHLAPDRIPQREVDGKNKHHQSNVASSTGMLRTMVLTPTKEVPSNLSSSTHSASNTLRTSNNCNNKTAASSNSNMARSRSGVNNPPIPHLTRSSSTTSYNTNAIDRLHSKAIHQRLQHESTPYQRMKERVATMMSNMMDCACCQDTTVAPLESSLQAASEEDNNMKQSKKSMQQQQTKISSQPSTGASPNTKQLRSRGIGGLSFEETSCHSGRVGGEGQPALSFEKSFS